MDKKVSVIIPCYNVTNTIHNCLNALVQQTIGIEALEIILVNDASTDNTLELLCEWEQRYPDSIMVIHCEENGMPGQARNIGMQYASAKYIGFADDDDICEPDMFEVLYNAAENNQCDLVICQSVRQQIQFSEINRSKESGNDEILNITSATERLAFLERDTNNAVWNKLYRKDMLLDNSIFFPAHTYYEDLLFSNLVKQYCTKVYISKKVLYHHIVGSSSISNNTNPERRMNFLEVTMQVIEEAQARGFYQNFEAWYGNYFVTQYLGFIINFEMLFGKMNPDVFQIIRENVLSLFPDFMAIPLVRLYLRDNHNPEFRIALRELIGHSKPVPVKRVLVLKGISRYDVLRDFANTLIRSFQNMSITVDIYDGTDAFAIQDQINHCKAQTYDFVFAFNGIMVGSQETFLKNPHTLFWSFLVDHPYYHHERLLEKCSNHFVSCIDRKHVTYLQTYYNTIKYSCFMPHGGNLPTTEPKPYSERQYKVIFTGSYSSSETIAKQIDQLPKDIRQIVQNVMQTYLTTYSSTLEELFLTEFKKYHLSLSNSEFTNILNSLTFVDEALRSQNRKKIIDTLTQNHIMVDVFGSGWENYPCKNPDYIRIHGQLSYSEILDTMCDSKIVLNALPLFTDGSHERVFTSMLCGAVCLSERNTYLEQEFTNKKDICFFDMPNIDALPSIVQRLLSDDKTAEQIAKQGMTVAKEKHTWEHRASNIIAIVEDILNHS